MATSNRKTAGSCAQHYFPFPHLNEKFISKKDIFFLFETVRCDRENHKSYLFFDPVKVIRVTRPEDISEAFADIEKLSRRFFLAGYFSYELGYWLDSTFENKTSPSTPFIYLGVFDRIYPFDHKTNSFERPLPVGLLDKKNGHDRAYSLKSPANTLDRKKYTKAVHSIREKIRQGQTYQVNYTNKISLDFSGSPFSFYNDLKRSQATAYSAFCKTGRDHFLSLSPELFLKRNRDMILSRPMKGTARRGRNIYEDKNIIDSFLSDKKEKAENLMIVDLIRNDIGRISKTGTVKVQDMFSVETYDSLFQMTSTVKGNLKKDITYFDIFQSLFPCGSVTGAPKRKTMEIIQSLEAEPRNIYCGALGMILPRKKAVFNIPIRTVSLHNNTAVMDVGSGIVWDSSPEKEFNECQLKRFFLTDRRPQFEIIETMLWKKRYRHLEKHLERMKFSAQYFQFPFNSKKLRQKLRALSDKFLPQKKYRVRVLLSPEGRISFSSSPIEETVSKRPRVCLSAKQTQAHDVFLYHKTTQRQLYNKEYQIYREQGYFDVLFLNADGYLTEGAITNIFVVKNGLWFTPPVTCGLLSGICRQYVLEKYNVIFRKMTIKDLYESDEIVLTNSVRGIVRNVELENQK